MSIRIIISGATLVGIVTAAIGYGSEDFANAFHSFIDAPSLIIVLGVVISGTLWSFPTHTIFQSILDSFSADELDEERAKQGYFVFQNMAGYAVGGGIIGTVIGLVKMLKDLSDPTAIGPAMAIALLTIIYGVLLGEVVFKSMANSCLSKNPSKLQRQDYRGFVTLYASLFALFVLITTFMTMLLAFATFD